MSAVGLRYRAELRTRWRAWVGLALLLGLAGGIVAAVVTAARRTDTVVDRFHHDYRGYDVWVTNFPDPGVSQFDPAKIAALPGVAASARAHQDYFGPTGQTVFITPADDAFGRDVSKLKVVRGRLPDPARADEVVVGTGFADALGADVGEQVPLFNPQQVPPEAQELFTTKTLTVVGEVAMPNAVAVPSANAPGGLIIGTKALHDDLTRVLQVFIDAGELAPQTDGVMVRLTDGPAGIDAFRDRLQEIAEPRGELSIEAAPVLTRDLRRSLHLQTVGLWLLAGLLAVVALVSVVATMRQSAVVDERDAATLQALGFPNRAFALVDAGRGVFIGIIGTIVTVVVAIALSPALLFGEGRTIESQPGVRVDGVVVVLALLLVVSFSVVTAMATGALARRRQSHVARLRVARRPSATNVPVGLGVRFACVNWSLLGRGIVGPALGIGALTAALVFAGSFAHLRNDPALYGWQWDAVLVNYSSVEPGSVDPGSPEGLDMLRTAPGVAGAATGRGIRARVGDKPLAILAASAAKGDTESLLPPVVEGRTASAPDEVSMTGRTMRDLGVDIGDRVDVKTDQFGSATFTVVGEIVMPPLMLGVPSGEGAVVSNDALGPLGVPDLPKDDIATAEYVFLRLTPGAVAETVRDSLNDELGGSAPQLYVQPRTEPNDLIDFGKVDDFPLLLGAAVALFAAFTLAHVLVTSVRRRRHDFATLRALGLGRTPVTGIVVSQAGFLGLMAIVVGLPLGILAGRLAWAFYAHRIGFISVVRVPVAGVALVALAAVLVAEVCALIPARRAARVSPALALRSE